ncbi:WhiB family transcriptional regulator [Streptomyces sp. H27-H5]|uniref:WhiB family transcriptional regulator n=1 Tax=Streptomyces sp. H27-H5 TaxID=2996460 RepID=UPI002270FCE5|nr:WhiB family transcriptional regulator [Streptomyces sp. H27-H5]MCY0957662.1 WhiB family transcriptional regulator [Streptomyces sp. H27-H5]
MPRPGRYWPDTRHAPNPRPPHWDQDAACRLGNPLVFFPEGEKDAVLEDTAEAKRICRTCPVIHPCLVEALERGEQWGVWGGLDEGERERLLLRRRAQESTDVEEAADVGAPAAAAA